LKEQGRGGGVEKQVHQKRQRRQFVRNEGSGREINTITKKVVPTYLQGRGVISHASDQKNLTRIGFSKKVQKTQGRL